MVVRLHHQQALEVVQEQELGLQLLLHQRLPRPLPLPLDPAPLSEHEAP